MDQLPEYLYEFGPFRLHAGKRVLLRDGEIVPLTSKVFDLLLLLIEGSGQVLHKEEMMKALWPDTVVEENNLTQQISTLRKILGESAAEHRYVVTIPGRGYSFVADVMKVQARNSDLIQKNGSGSLVISDHEDHAQTKTSSPENNGKYIPVEVAEVNRRPARINFPRLAIFVLITGLAAVVLFQWFTSDQKQPPGTTPKSIAVLPFRSLNTEANDEFLGSGMADTLIAKLSNIHQITVRPTSSIIKYVGVNPDTVSAGRELGVDSVLEGTVQKSGDRVRVTVQLLSVRDGKTIWAQTFDETLNDIFVMQDAITEQVAQEMVTRLNDGDQERIRKHYTNNVEAYQAYVKGRYFWNKRDEENLKKSIQYFQQAIDLDPQYALAYSGMADAYNLLISYGFSHPSENESSQKARAAVVRALELDDTLGEAHASLGLILLYRDGNSAAAQKEFQRAIELDPNYATAHHWYSDYLAIMNRPDEAMAAIKRAQELDPLSAVINTTLGERLFYARRYDEAIEQLRKTLEVAPNFYQAHLALGMAYEQKGQHREAAAELQRAKELSGGNAQTVAALGHYYAIAGRQVEARQVLSELIRANRARPYEIATIYIGLGENQQALEWLQKEDIRFATWLLNSDPRMVSVRSDSRFKNLART